MSRQVMREAHLLNALGSVAHYLENRVFILINDKTTRVHSCLPHRLWGAHYALRRLSLYFGQSSQSVSEELPRQSS